MRTIIFSMFSLGLAFSPVKAATMRANSDKTKTIKVLSLDGGGIRGVLEAYYLMQIEAAAAKPIYELFDVIAGTSTGGIITLGLTIPAEDGRPRFTAEQLYNLYASNGHTIFQKSWYLFGLLGSKYKASGLEAELRNYFGESPLACALTNVLITSYDLASEDAVLFSSAEAKSFPSKNIPAWKAARATSAAPTFFKPIQVEYPMNSGNRTNLVDGGIYRNNPSMLAYLEARKLYPDRDIEVYSLGTARNENPMVYKDRGILGWGTNILHHMFVSMSKADSDFLHETLNKGPKKRYFRINTRLDENHVQMDDFSKKNIAYLTNAARNVVKGGQFKAMVSNLLKVDSDYLNFPVRENGCDLVHIDSLEDPFVLMPEEIMV